MEAATTERLDEMALRRPPLAPGVPRSSPGFRRGVSIRLSDGQDWVLPRPRVLLSLDDEQDRGYRLAFNLGPGFDDLYEALARAEGGFDVIVAEMRLARFLLRLNYDVTDAQAADLIRFAFEDDEDDDQGDDPAGASCRKAVVDLLLGRTPAGKATAVGSD